MSLYLYKPHPKLLEAEEGINMSLYFIQTQSKAVRREGIICHYIYTNPIQSC